MYTIRKQVDSTLNIDKVLDANIKRILEERLQKFGEDAKKAFANLDKNPIWLNEKKGIAIKRVTITGISNAESLHEKKDKDGQFILDENGYKQPIDFVSTGNNHHGAIYRDEQGNLQEQIVSFYEAIIRANTGLPIIDKQHNQQEGWKFLFTLKQNEYFVFPNEKTGFNPHEIDLMNAEHYHLISPNLFRVQTISSKDYRFRHHLETMVENKKELKEITHKRIQSLNYLNGIVKVRVNHIGQIVSIGEY